MLVNFYLFTPIPCFRTAQFKKVSHLVYVSLKGFFGYTTVSISAFIQYQEKLGGYASRENETGLSLSGFLADCPVRGAITLKAWSLNGKTKRIHPQFHPESVQCLCRDRHTSPIQVWWRRSLGHGTANGKGCRTDSRSSRPFRPIRELSAGSFAGRSCRCRRSAGRACGHARECQAALQAEPRQTRECTFGDGLDDFVACFG